MPNKSFKAVSEAGGVPVTAEASEMIRTRYLLAAHLARGRRVLEVGVAAGLGNTLFRDRGAQFVGGDIDGDLLSQAKAVSPTGTPLVQFDAQLLPFRDTCFDVVLVMECAYYLPSPEQMFEEIRRVLAHDGVLLVVSANPRRPDFIRSPHSHRYHTPSELTESLKQLGMRSVQWGAFKVIPPDALGRAQASLLSGARRLVQRVGLVPSTLEGRARLKRLVYGPLPTLPDQLPSDATCTTRLEKLEAANEAQFKVFYTIASSTTQLPSPPEGMVLSASGKNAGVPEYLVLTRSRTLPIPTVAIDPEYRMLDWQQTAFSFWPPGARDSWQYLAWFLIYLRKTAPLRAVVIEHVATRRVAHLTLLHPSYFRFPFMEAADLQVGGLWTEPEHRRRGLAIAAVVRALELAAHSSGQVWYVVARQNFPSVALAEKLNFKRELEADRTSHLGLKLLGAYNVVRRF